MSNKSAFNEWWDTTNHEWRRTLMNPSELNPIQLAKEAWDAALTHAAKIVTKDPVYTQSERYCGRKKRT